MAKSQEEKIQQKLEDAERMLQVNLQAGRGFDDYNVQKLQGEIRDHKAALDKLNKVAAKRSDSDLKDLLVIRRGDCLGQGHSDRVYDLYKKGLLSESEAMNQDF